MENNTATISNQGVLIPKILIDKKILCNIKNKLTVKKEATFGNFPITKFTVFIEDKDTITIPIPFFLSNINELGLNSIKYKIQFNSINKFKDNLNFSKVILSDEQDKCIKVLLNIINNNEYGQGIIEMATGSGKTLVSLRTFYETKLTTLIIVNKIELIEQWINEINKWLCIPKEDIGIIQGNVFNVKNKKIVIGMLQTISIKKTIDNTDFNWCDLVFIDEVHNLGSEVFSNLLFKVRPRYIFGLTATVKRKDKLEKVFFYHLGDIIYSNINTSLKQITNINIYTYKGNSSKELLMYDNHTPKISTMLSNIANDKERNLLLLNIINNIIKDPNRSILLLSDRISQLKFLNNKLKDYSSLFIGGVKLDKSNIKQVILATYSIANEGFNYPKLNTLIFGTPRSSITQSIGRIYRKHHDITPLIIDIIDDFSIFKGQSYRRRTIYKKHINNPVISLNDLRSSESNDFTCIKNTHKDEYLFDNSDCENSSENEFLFSDNED